MSIKTEEAISKKLAKTVLIQRQRDDRNSAIIRRSIIF